MYNFSFICTDFVLFCEQKALAITGTKFFVKLLKFRILYGIRCLFI